MNPLLASVQVTPVSNVQRWGSTPGSRAHQSLLTTNRWFEMPPGAKGVQKAPAPPESLRASCPAAPSAAAPPGMLGLPAVFPHPPPTQRRKTAVVKAGATIRIAGEFTIR